MDLLWDAVVNGTIPSTLKGKKQLAKIMNLERGWQKVKSKKHQQLLNEKLQEQVQDIQSMRSIISENERDSREMNDFVLKLEGYKGYMYGACIHFLPSGSGCVLDNGLILTCAHCIDHEDDPDEGSRAKQPSRVGRVRPIIWADGKLALVECVYSSEDTDIAFCKIIKTHRESYPTVKLCSKPADVGTEIVIIHNPFGNDLENEDQGAKSGNLPFTTSVGEVKGYEGDAIKVNAYGQGSLLHSCWTYWGTSGAPLFNKKGHIVGMHNSWNQDGETYKNKKALLRKKVNRRGVQYVYVQDKIVERRAIPWTALRHCLDEYTGTKTVYNLNAPKLEIKLKF